MKDLAYDSMSSQQNVTKVLPPLFVYIVLIDFHGHFVATTDNQSGDVDEPIAERFMFLPPNGFRFLPQHNWKIVSQDAKLP